MSFLGCINRSCIFSLGVCVYVGEMYCLREFCYAMSGF